MLCAQAAVVAREEAPQGLVVRHGRLQTEVARGHLQAVYDVARSHELLLVQPPDVLVDGAAGIGGVGADVIEKGQTIPA